MEYVSATEEWARYSSLLAANQQIVRLVEVKIARLKRERRMLDSLMSSLEGISGSGHDYEDPFYQDSSQSDNEDSVAMREVQQIFPPPDSRFRWTRHREECFVKALRDASTTAQPLTASIKKCSLLVGASPMDCFLHYCSKLPSTRDPTWHWNEQRNEILWNEVAVHRYGNWRAIAAALDHARTPMQCLQRFRELSRTRTFVGRTAGALAIEEGLELYGSDYRLVAAHAMLCGKQVTRRTVVRAAAQPHHCESLTPFCEDVIGNTVRVACFDAVYNDMIRVRRAMRTLGRAVRATAYAEVHELLFDPWSLKEEAQLIKQLGTRGAKWDSVSKSVGRSRDSCHHHAIALAQDHHRPPITAWRKPFLRKLKCVMANVVERPSAGEAVVCSCVPPQRVLSVITPFSLRTSSELSLPPKRVCHAGDNSEAFVEGDVRMPDGRSIPALPSNEACSSALSALIRTLFGIDAIGESTANCYDRAQCYVDFSDVPREGLLSLQGTCVALFSNQLI